MHNIWAHLNDKNSANYTQEKSSKQLNLMASPTDKSFKVITATIQSILKWKHYKDKVALLYEIFGKNVTFLFSQNSSSPALNLFKIT